MEGATMAIIYACDRCGQKTTKAGEVKRYVITVAHEAPVYECTTDLCDKCIETAWRAIQDQCFRTDRHSS
jgi:hypothetical protein